MQIKSHKLRNRQFENWHSDLEDHWDYDDFIRDDNWRKDWISFDCLCYVPEKDTVYTGITSFDADIFWGWDRKSESWVSTGYDRIADPFDAKFHRSLVYHNGHLWGACALLHDIDNYWEAPGSPIIKYHPKTNVIKRLPAVLPHVYIQAIILEEKEDIIYGITLTPERLVSYNIKTDQRRDLGPIGSGVDFAQGENIVFDDDGNIWGGWVLTRAWQSNAGVDRHRLFRYSPKEDRINYLKKRYKMRWKIELFFKWIKRNVPLKTFFGNNDNAVGTQVWVAVCTYLIVAIINRDFPFKIEKIIVALR